MEWSGAPNVLESIEVRFYCCKDNKTSINGKIYSNKLRYFNRNRYNYLDKNKYMVENFARTNNLLTFTLLFRVFVEYRMSLHEIGVIDF